jgi:hypothetical protein
MPVVSGLDNRHKAKSQMADQSTPQEKMMISGGGCDEDDDDDDGALVGIPPLVVRGIIHWRCYYYTTRIKIVDCQSTDMSVSICKSSLAQTSK